MKEASNKFLFVMSLIATPLAAGAFLLAWGPGDHYFDFSPANDGYVAPRNISETIDETQKSTVTVYCNITKDKGTQGTAWVIDSGVLQISSERTTLMTN
jgi:hypothetical protein